MFAAYGGLFGCEGEGDPDLSEAGFDHLWPHDADDSVRLSVEVDGFADGVGIGSIVGLPELVAENDFVVFAGVIFFGQEDPSVKRLDPENGKKLRAYWACHDGLGLAGSGDVEVCAGGERHLVADVVLFLPVEEVRCGHGEARHSGEALLWSGVPDVHETVGVAEGNSSTAPGAGGNGGVEHNDKFKGKCVGLTERRDG